MWDFQRQLIINFLNNEFEHYFGFLALQNKGVVLLNVMCEGILIMILQNVDAQTS